MSPDSGQCGIYKLIIARVQHGSRVGLEPTTLGLAESRSHLTNRKLTRKADRSKVEFYGTMEPEDPKNLWLSQGY